MSTSYQDRLRRWLASNTAGSTLIMVIEFQHASFGSRYINDYGRDLDVTLETSQQVTTEFVGFNLNLPSVKNNTKQEMTVTVDNTSGIPYAILKGITPESRFGDPLTMRVRFYLDDDLASPQLDPPLSLEVRNAAVENTSVSFTAVSPFMRKEFTGLLYTSETFPSLYSFWS